jgi:YHS domain-containing protein
MAIDESAAAGSSSRQGATFYFCRSGRQARSEANPEEYAPGGHQRDGDHQYRDAAGDQHQAVATVLVLVPAGAVRRAALAQRTGSGAPAGCW